MNALQILQQARDKIAIGWTQGWFARDIYDKRVEISSTSACKFCLSGALWQDDATGEQVLIAKRLLNAHIGTRFDNIVDFNDNVCTKQEDVLALLDKTIENAKGFY